MLNDMQAQLKAEAAGDEEAYDKMQCYCRTNEAEKSKAIADGNANSASLTHMIEEMTATMWEPEPSTVSKVVSVQREPKAFSQPDESMRSPSMNTAPA